MVEMNSEMNSHKSPVHEDKVLNKNARIEMLCRSRVELTVYSHDDGVVSREEGVSRRGGQAGVEAEQDRDAEEEEGEVGNGEGSEEAVGGGGHLFARQHAQAQHVAHDAEAHDERQQHAVTHELHAK